MNRLALLCCCFWLAGLGSARAADWTLDWQAPAECPSAAELRAEIERRVAPTAGDLEVHAVVQATTAGYHVELRLQGAVEGVRELDAATCPSLSRAVALIVILALDPGAATSLSEQLAEPAVAEPPPAPPPPAPQPVPVAPPVAPPPPSPWQGSVSAGLGLEVGWVPGVAVGPTAALGIVHRHLRASALVGFVPQSGVPGSSAAGSAGLSASLAWLAFGARACAGFGQQIELWGCFQARAAWLQAEGQGAQSSERVESWAVLLEPGIALRVPFARGWGIEGAAFATLPTSAHRFVFTAPSGAPVDEIELFRLSPGATLSLSLDLRFQ